MDDSMSTRRIYTTLDSLFDTELAYLDLIDPRLSREYFTDEYNIEDSYLYLSYSSFREMFKNRDKRVLGYSKATSVPDLIRGIINDMDIKRKTGETVNSKITLTINTYPYKLDMDEEKEIIDFHKKYFLFLDNIELIHKKEISKAFINKLAVIVDRYGIDWYFSMKMKYVGDFQCPHVRLIVPDRFHQSNYLKNNGVDTGKMIEYLRTILITDVRLDIIEKETFMLKISTDKEM